MDKDKLFWISLIPAVFFTGWLGSLGGWIASFMIIWYGLFGLLFSYLWYKRYVSQSNLEKQ